jgi:hypothetical protein
MGAALLTFGTAASAQQVGCEVTMPQAFRLLERQSPASGGPNFPAQTRVRVIARGSAVQGGTRAMRVRIDTAEGWLYLWPSQVRRCPAGSIAERPGDVVPTSEDHAPSTMAGTSMASACTPGASQACACDGGRSGVQTCTASGTFNPCTCAAQPVGDPVSDQMRVRVRQFARGFIAVTGLLRVRLQEGQSRTYVVAVVGGHCYRVVGVGGPGVNDVDIAFRDLTGNLIDTDHSDDNLPLVGIDHQLCLPAGMGNQSVQLELRLAHGEGEVGAQVFGSP